MKYVNGEQTISPQAWSIEKEGGMLVMGCDAFKAVHSSIAEKLQAEASFSILRIARAD